ncbi:Aro80 protein [Saccharomycopsis crataegensis]|uniref:Aro80 protein n=1 Tax=Saccharomycopsis crataegensis TaxID=43959 RepID=A0AAV5QMY0_9ASCO|nr:Aro80 protein [Saccharomycopsis crataegensis]
MNNILNDTESSPISQDSKRQKISFDGSQNTNGIGGLASSSSGKQFKRSYKACLSCRTRKIKCDLGSPSNPIDPPCARCRRERKDCVFAESRRGAGARKKKDKDGLGDGLKLPDINSLMGQRFPNPIQGANYTNPTIEQQRSIVQSYGKLSQGNNTSEVSTMQGALLFLANAAGTIAKADERDRLIGGKLSQDGSTVTTTENIAPIPSNRDADILEIMNNNRSPTPDIQEIVPKIRLSAVEYIGEGKILSEKEATDLVDFYFNYMHPFYPYITPDLHDANVLTSYPILLCAILTISSRYKPLIEENVQENEDTNTGTGKPARSPQADKRLETHEKLWIYCQKLVSQSVWGEASTRSIGTVFAFLLFTEWNPRAIHWKWDDYANIHSIITSTSDGKTANNGKDEDSLAGIGAMRRSSRMSWMLCGTSIRLAQDMGFMENSSRVFVATHLSETTIAMTCGQRSMLAQSLAEVNMNDEATFTESYQKEDEIVLIGDEDALKSANRAEQPLKFTLFQRANVELLKISSLAYETLYCGRSYAITDQKQILAILSILSPLLEGWEAKYRKLLEYQDIKINPSTQYLVKNAIKLTKDEKSDIKRVMDHESLRFDYYYAQLYIYSLALFNEPSGASQTSSKKHLRLDELTKASKYIELAFQAAKEILATATRVHKLRMLRFMPVRWVTRIVRSVAFVVKCYMTLTSNINNNYSSTIVSLSVIPTDDIVQTIQKAAITLREASPDELHLCTRYSTILMYLCSEMRASKAAADAQYNNVKKANKKATNTKESKNSDDDDNNNNVDESETVVNYNTDSNQPPSTVATTNDTSVTGPQQQLPYQPPYTDASSSYQYQYNSNGMYNPGPNYEQNNMNNGSTSVPSHSYGYSTNLPQQYGNDGYNGQSMSGTNYSVYLDQWQTSMQNFGLDFVDPFTERIEQRMRDNNASTGTIGPSHVNGDNQQK